MRARPSAEMLATQHQAEDTWRRDVAKLPFEVKVRQVIEMQHTLYPVLASRCEQHWWQRPWPVRS